MVNLFQDSTGSENYIVDRPFRNTVQYKAYLDRRLFMALESQTVSCPVCGNFNVKSKTQKASHLKACPQCGDRNAFFLWTANFIGPENSVDILINRNYVFNSIPLVLMLSSIADKHKLKVSWYFKASDGQLRKLII